MLDVGAPLRGVAAFFATYVTALVLANLFAALFGSTNHANIGAWLIVGGVVAIFLAPLVLIAPVSILLLRLARLPRPIADAIVSAASFVALLYLWGPLLAGITDNDEPPTTTANIVLAAGCGAVWGLVYWRFAGDPTPA
jgi:hypothetical protein